MKRSELRRKTPPESASALRRTPMRPTRPPGIPAAVRRLVNDRDGRICLACGCVRPGLLVLNHRSSGMGGNRPQTCEYLHVACRLCNDRFENQPLWAYGRGFKLRAGSDPVSTPVIDYTGQAFYLLPDGTRTPAPKEAP